MFLRLQIDNFAIIEHSRIEFHDGFSVLTGETGAGKSIIMDAISLLLGARAQKQMIRKNADCAVIQGVFMTRNKRTLEFLKDRHIPFEDVIIIERTIYRDRPSMSEINGKAVTNSVLREFGETIALSGMQGENGFLMQPAFQLELIDAFCGADHRAKLAELRTSVKDYRELDERLNEEDKDPQAVARESDLLRYQIDELETLAMQRGEDDALAEEFHARSHHASTLEHLKELSQMSFDDDGIRALMDRFAASLEKVVQNDASYEEIFEQFEDIRYQFQDIASTLRERGENFEDDPERLAIVSERLDAINQAKRKYGETYDLMEEFLEESRARLSYLEDYDRNLESLAKKRDTLFNLAMEQAALISETRRTMAKKIESRLAEEMRELDINGAGFEVEFTDKPLSEDGTDFARFMISTNKGEDLMPLSEIASGGEMSRIFLAFISIYAEFDDREILILDEVDTGMSGKTAKVVARKMAKLSKDRQLIVVSHLPQVVARADRQYRILKREEDGRTVSVVDELSMDERISYLATMISGADTEKTRETAREMLLERHEEEL